MERRTGREMQWERGEMAVERLDRHRGRKRLGIRKWREEKSGKRYINSSIGDGDGKKWREQCKEKVRDGERGGA